MVEDSNPIEGLWKSYLGLETCLVLFNKGLFAGSSWSDVHVATTLVQSLQDSILAQALAHPDCNKIDTFKLIKQAQRSENGKGDENGNGQETSPSSDDCEASGSAGGQETCP